MRAALLVALTVCTGCSSAVGTNTGSGNRITAEQIAAVRAESAYDAVQALRPAWLTDRGPSSMSDSGPTKPVVYMDGIRAGGLDYLRTVRRLEIIEMRYLSPSDASLRFGLGHQGGVIEVITRATGRT